MTDHLATQQRNTDTSETTGEVDPLPITLELGPHQHRLLFSMIVEALTAPDGYDAGLSRLGEELRMEAETRFLRFYYEEILERSPEAAVFACDPVDDPADCIRYLLSSDEFMSQHDIVLQRAFPNLTRELFLHIPKSGGTTLLQAFGSDNRFCPLYLFPGFDNGWFADRLNYLRKSILRLINQNAQYVFVGGHPTASRIITNHLKRGWDNAFATVRDPIEAGVSWINYVLTLFANDPAHPDVLTWRDMLEVPADQQFPDHRAALDLIPKIVDRLVLANAICSTLGLEPQFDSAIETAIILDLKIVRVEQIDDYIRSRGISTYKRMNESEKYIKLSDLDQKTRLMLYDKNNEDLKFYNWLSRHSVPGDGPWCRL